MAMNPSAKIAALETKRAELEAALSKPDISEARAVAIRGQVGKINEEIAGWTAKVDVPRPPRRFLWWTFEPGLDATIEFYTTLIGVPVGLYYLSRHWGKAYFLWRQPRLPYPKDRVTYLCWKYGLSPDHYKVGRALDTTAWQEDALKGALWGAGTIVLTMYSRVFQRRGTLWSNWRVPEVIEQ